MPNTFALEWDKTGEHWFSTGVDRGVVYPWDKTTSAYGTGEAWNGLTSVDESPEGGEASPYYANNRKYLNLMSTEEFAGSIGAYTYPDAFAGCIGESNNNGLIVTGQPHKPFCFTYREPKGNDTDGIEAGYILHLVYNALATPPSRSHATTNESPEPEEMSWDFTTTSEEVPGAKPTAHFKIDSTTLDADGKAALTSLEQKLYGTPASGGTAAVDPAFPTITELLALFQ
jgi:hypothetical protein